MMLHASMLFFQANQLSQELLESREVEFVDIATDQFSNGEVREDLVSSSWTWGCPPFHLCVLCRIALFSSLRRLEEAH